MNLSNEEIRQALHKIVDDRMPTQTMNEGADGWLRSAIADPNFASDIEPTRGFMVPLVPEGFDIDSLDPTLDEDLQLNHILEALHSGLNQNRK